MLLKLYNRAQRAGIDARPSFEAAAELSEGDTHAGVSAWVASSGSVGSLLSPLGEVEAAACGTDRSRRKLVTVLSSGLWHQRNDF